MLEHKENKVWWVLREPLDLQDQLEILGQWELQDRLVTLGLLDHLACKEIKVWLDSRERPELPDRSVLKVNKGIPEPLEIRAQSEIQDHPDRQVTPARQETRAQKETPVPSDLLDNRVQTVNPDQLEKLEVQDCKDLKETQEHEEIRATKAIQVPRAFLDRLVHLAPLVKADHKELRAIRARLVLLDRKEVSVQLDLQDPMVSRGQQDRQDNLDLKDLEEMWDRPEMQVFEAQWGRPDPSVLQDRQGLPDHQVQWAALETAVKPERLDQLVSLVSKALQETSVQLEMPVHLEIPDQLATPVPPDQLAHLDREDSQDPQGNLAWLEQTAIPAAQESKACQEIQVPLEIPDLRVLSDRLV